ncbi:MAG: hypothetical protein H6876_02590 [Hyphomicrobiaceae bacterium]|nr:hypothetical protein [Hyphomicrobiaceae bacterium]MCC0006994.1 hypothetical protein [Hyphomicrobiaceae bacterium]
MTRSQAEIVYGAIIGALVGICYLLGKALWAGDITTAFNSSLLLAAVVGSAAGALAFFLRRQMG